MTLFRRHISHLFFAALFIAITFLVAPEADAAIKTWDGGGADNNWTTVANWDLDVLPATTDSVVFDATSTKNVTIDGTAKTIAGFSMNTGYIGVITATTNVINTSTFTLASGTLDLGSTTWDQRASWTKTGGTLTPNTSTLIFYGTQTITGSVSLTNVTFRLATSSQVITIASGTTITVTGILTFYGGTSRGSIVGPGNVYANGNIVFASSSDVGMRGTADIIVNGTGDQSITGGTGVNSIPVLTINKASGTLTLANNIYISDNFTYTAGTVDPGTSTVVFWTNDNNATLNGSVTLANVKFQETGSSNIITIASGTTITVTGTLTFYGSTGRGQLNGSGGSGIAAKGNIVFASSTDKGVRGTAIITVNGTVDQAITGGDSIQTMLSTLTINKSSGTLTITNTISISNDFTYTAGTLSLGSATIAFFPYHDAAATITGSFTAPNVWFVGGSNYAITIAANTMITVTSLLTLQGGIGGTRPQLNSSSGAASGITLQGNLVYNSTDDIGFRGKNSSGVVTDTVLTINGTGTQTITGGLGTSTQIPATTINKLSGTLTISNYVTFSDNFVYSTGTLSVTGATIGFYPYSDGYQTLTGSFTAENVYFGASSNNVITLAANTMITVTTQLKFQSGLSATRPQLNSSSGAASGITLQGNLVFNASDDKGFRGKNSSGVVTDTVLTINGTGIQTITGGSGIATMLPATTINKSGGTLTFADTMTISDNFRYIAGTVNPGTSTIAFIVQSDSSATITGSLTLNNVWFQRIGTDTITIASGTTLTVAGTLTMDGAASGLTVNGPGAISAQGGITQISYGAAGSVQVTANGTGNQVLTGGGSTTIGNFPPLYIDKSSGTLKLVSIFRTNYSVNVTQGVFEHDTTATNGLYFSAAGSVMNISSGGTWRNYSATGTSTIDFSSASAVTVTNSGAVDFEAIGTCGGADIISLSKVSGTASWTGAGTFKMYDVSLTNQGASVAITVNSGTNVSGNTGSWTFDAGCPSLGISIAGTVYTDEGATAMTTTPVVRVKVNGGGSFSTTAAANGTYTVSNVTQPLAADVITIYLDGATEDAVLVTRYSSGNLTVINLYQNRVIIRHEDAGPTTNTNLDTWDSGNDLDILFTVTAGALTVSDGAKLLIWTGDTFTPGGTVTTSPSADGTDSVVDGDVEVQTSGTLSMEANALSVGGDFTNAGTFSKSSGQTTTFTATATGHTIDNGTGNFDIGVFNGASGGWSFVDASNTFDGDVTMTAGTLYGTNGMTVNGGDITGDGTINFTGGTVLLDTAGNFGGATAWTFNNLTFGDGTGATATTASGSGGITVSGVLTIAANQTLNAGSKTWTVTGTSGTPLAVGGTFTPATSTVVYTGNNGAGNTTVANVTYNNLVVNNASETYVLAGHTTASGNVTITAGTLDATATNYNLTVGGNFANSGTFTAREGTVTLNGAAQQVLSGTMTGSSAFYKLTITNTSGTNASDCERTSFTPSVDFNAAATVTNDYTITTPLVRVEYNSGSTYTFANINWAGSSGNLIFFRNSAATGTWSLNVSGTQTAVSYVNVSRSDASSGSQISALGGTNTNCNNNTNWQFYISGSLYSQDHANVDGDLYIYGNYSVPTSSIDYWSYATDFDGTALGGSSRQVDVRLSSGASVTVPSTSTLQAIGGSGVNQTTVDWQSAGGYTMTVAGTINAQYYTVNHIKGPSGLNLQSTATVTSLSNGSFDNIVSSATDAFITVAASLIGIGQPSKTINTLSFANTGSGAECNFNVSGSAQTGYWNVSGASGAFSGESYDCEPTASPGEIRWVAGGYAASGYFISATFDTQRTNGVAYNTLLWKGTEPTNTNVKIQLATSNSSSGPWTYRGPDCTISTHYAPNPNAVVEIKCFTDHNNKRYFKYKVTLETTDPAATPEVQDVVVNYSQ